jgi:hypothetical protein
MSAMRPSGEHDMQAERPALDSDAAFERRRTGKPGQSGAIVLTLSVVLTRGAAILPLLAQATTLAEYNDPVGRFHFSYPARYGAVSSGTDDGFRDRVAARRFAAFPAQLGGEVVVTRGFPLVDLQAVGGLYDPLTLTIFPEPLRSRIVQLLPQLSIQNLCEMIARPSHVNPNAPEFAPLTAQQKTVLSATDAMRNTDPRVVRCVVTDDVVMFDKEVSFQAGSPRQHVFGAVRFLDGPYPTVQFIGGGRAPDGVLLNEMTAVVKSWTPSR